MYALSSKNVWRGLAVLGGVIWATVGFLIDLETNQLLKAPPQNVHECPQIPEQSPGVSIQGRDIVIVLEGGSYVHDASHHQEEFQATNAGGDQGGFADE